MDERRGRVVAAATDGACSGNPGPGGWGALLRFEDGSVEEFGGYEPATTNNRMELQAALTVLQKLRQLPRHPDLTIRTDSKYLIDGLSRWMLNWKRKGWRTAAGKPVLNQDLWQSLDQARIPDLALSYVKGHSGDPDNDRVDQIAVAFSKGTDPGLRSVSSQEGFARAESFANQEESLNQLASPSLQQLLSRVELADRLAQGDYSLSSVELAQLVEQPLAKLQGKTDPWRWRDWQVEPLAGGRWRLRRAEAGSNQI